MNKELKLSTFQEIAILVDERLAGRHMETAWE
jgi:hypothetical protein